jgi:hypothetical protein
MGRLEFLWGIKQAPADISGKVAFIPFQTHDPEVSEEDKKLPYLMYFFLKKRDT